MDYLTVARADAATPPAYTLVTTLESFQSMLEGLMPASRLAIDVEGDSLYHYFEKVCLVQISTDRETFILDPLMFGEIRTLAPLMSSVKVEKVFHAASYDVQCLRRDFGFSFTNIFDTHIAAQLLGHEYLGLDVLMEKLLGISHSKGRQRDDWSRRPLATEQLEYAAMDTHHLLQLRDTLEAQLRERGRLSWAQEEFEASAMAERPDKEYDTEGFRKIKGSRELPLQGLAVLRALYLLRDSFARELDVPAFKVLNNSTLLDLARRLPSSPHEMFKRPGISSRVARKYAGKILRAIAEAREEDPSLLRTPARNNWKSPTRETKLRLDTLKIWRQAKARELDLHVGVVFPANLLENLAAFPPVDLQSLADLPGMRCWRVREFGEEVIRILHNSKP